MLGSWRAGGKVNLVCAVAQETGFGGHYVCRLMWIRWLNICLQGERRELYHLWVPVTVSEYNKFIVEKRFSMYPWYF